MILDDMLLDDPDGLAAADSRQLLPITASAGASMRAAALLVDPGNIEAIVAEGRPRAVVVTGGGGSRAAGEILSAVAGTRSPVPVFTVGGPSLPGWIGPTDLVICVSGGGGAPETLAVASEASRRGCRLVAVCPPKSALAGVLEATRGAVRFEVGVPPTGGTWRARSLIWSLSTPLILIGGGLGLVEDARGAVDRAADQLDDIADRCSPSRDSVTNLAKRWAVEVALSLPMLWGTGDVGAIAVQRFSRQLAENAGLPSIVGTLPEAARTQAALLAGPRAGEADIDDIFRDRVEEPEAAARLRLVMLRDGDENPGTASLADEAQSVAEARRVPVSVLRAEPGHPLERLAALIGMTDFVSVYAALALGTDPISNANDLDGRLGFSSGR